VCTSANTACDCNGTPATRFNPLCQNAAGAYTTTQVRAKGYPGTRHLQVLQGMGDQGIVASICPSKVTGNKNDPDYGYNPAVNALVDRLRIQLRGRCLPRQLEMDSAGAAPCIILEGWNVAGNVDCPCEGDAAHLGRITADPGVITADIRNDYRCICEIKQLEGAQLSSCQNNGTMDLAANGWCYVDPAQSQAADITEPCKIVANCGRTEKRIIRFSQSAEPRAGGKAFIMCQEKAYPTSGIEQQQKTCPAAATP
jgi:hypothetical protein